MTTTNRLAVVTGGIGGIGSAICVRLSQDGNKVVATYHPSEQDKAEEWQAEMREKGLDIGIVGGDVSSAEETSPPAIPISRPLFFISANHSCAFSSSDG